MDGEAPCVKAQRKERREEEKNKCCPAEIYELQPRARVCFMLFDGSGGGGERLTACQCHSLSADVSEQGTGLRGEINKLLFSGVGGKKEGKMKKNNTQVENARSALREEGSIFLSLLAATPEKQNVKSCYLGR